MAEVKNSFLGSKMNKDLDDRLIPSNEYRDALNIEVGKSNQDSVGALQIALGNYRLMKNSLPGDPAYPNTIPLENIPGLECIGYIMDNQNNRIYQFLTDYTDAVPSEINIAPIGTTHKITVYDFNTQVYSTLVEGIFLNFSKSNLITGINLIEGLLFWSDNRNQPRKINYFNCINDPNYYTDEVQISVAKYAPVDAPILFRKIITKATATQTSPYLNVTVEDATGITFGMTLVSNNISGCDYITVMSVTGNVVTLYSAPPNPILINEELTFMVSTMTNQEDNIDWPGDPAYLESRYVRFSYRFKYDDNEYSAFAPFSQIAFIPNQKGYFINGDEQGAYRSTILKWMQNNVNNIELLLTFPDAINNVADSYKITSVDILYKESDAVIVKVIDTVEVASMPSNSTNIYTYSYQSQKPYKTLTQDQIVRVYDKIPVRALAQELSGNRVIYGNFYTTYNAPNNINYNVLALPKSDIFSNFIEYPNHTLKQNRNYQVGFVLCDKFNRQSSVILSSVDLLKTAGFSGSTIYAPYVSENNLLFPGVKCWFGNALVLLVNDTIKSIRNISNGNPGLYAEVSGIQGKTNIGFQISSGVVSGNSYTYTLTGGTSQQNYPIEGKYLRGKYTDYVKVLPGSSVGSLTTDGDINDLYNYTGVNPDIKFSYEINQMGWYYYKVVVKQKEQDYYNVYLPGMLNGYPSKQTSGSQVTYTDPTVIYTQALIVDWVIGSTLITLASGNTGLMAVGDLVSGIIAGTATVTQIIDNTHFVILETPITNGNNQTITVFRAPGPSIAELQNGINITDFPVNETGRSSHIVLINDNINKVPRDLNEVGPDQTQYRSSVQLFGRVENYAQIVPLYGDTGVITDYTSTTIKYTIANNTQIPDILNYIKPGDGIQCVQSEIPVANPTPPGGTSIPFPWYKNTVIVSNVVDPLDPTKGIITFTPPNVLLDAGATTGEWKDFTITRAENVQYYPVRKADIVNTIAYAKDFNFEQNSVDNIRGSASINFYQLQGNPLIGRVSTSKPIGVIADDMLPTLSVYETQPVESLLDIFWETATTGYISDLNYDVNNGFDGAVGFSDFECDFRESQDPLGGGTLTGADNSPYITGEFYVLNNTNIPLNLTSLTLSSVFNNAIPTPINFINKFELEPSIITPLAYRIKIKKDFLFNFNSPTEGFFTFVMSAVVNGLTSTLSFTCQLKNAAPFFLLPASSYDTIITQAATNIVTLTATNGAHISSPQQTDDQDGLYFSLLSGNAGGWFALSPSTGVLSLIDPDIPLGVYPICVKVQDAMSFATNPPSPLINIDPEFATKEDIVCFKVTVGEEPIDDYLQYWNNNGCALGDMTEEDGTIYPTYFAIYVGKDIINLDLAGHSSSLPNPPSTPGYVPFTGWKEAYNVAYESGATGGGFPNPTGLTKGAIRFKATIVAGSTFGLANGLGSILIYYRQSNIAPNNVWQLVQDDNKAGSLTADWNLGVKADTYYDGTTNSELETVTAILRVSTPGEYCFAIRAWGQSGWPPAAVVEDANYYYNTVYPPAAGIQYVNPFPPVERYLVGLQEFLTNYPNAIPYTAFNAANGFNFTSTVVSTGTQPTPESFNITPTPDSIAGLLAEGLWYSDVTKITNVNPAGSLITLSQAETISGSVTFRESQTYGGIYTRDYGNIWVGSKDATFVKQIYTTPDFQNLWTPPIANRYYNFQNNPTISGPFTFNFAATNDIMAFNAAQVSSSGKVIIQTGSYSIQGYSRVFSDTLLPYTYQTIPYTLIPRRIPNNGICSYFSTTSPRITNVDTIGTTSAVAHFSADSTYRLTWSSEATTPTVKWYPNETYFPSGGFSAQSYTITGLQPDTDYYVLLYINDQVNGYVNGELFPYRFRTLPL